MAEKKRRRFTSCCLLTLLFPLLAFGALVIFAVVMGKTALTVEEGTILEIEFAGALPEGPSGGLLPTFFVKGKSSLFTIRQALRQGATDPKIAGLLLDIEHFGSGMAAVEEILHEVARFRDSGKPVQAFLRGDLVGEREYLLATAADDVWLAPESALAVNGFNAEVTFWKGTLDKLGIVPQVFMFKDYKSAGEPYSRYEMSEPFRESLQALLGDFMNSLVATIAKRRGLDETVVRLQINRGLMSPSEALQARWIDDLGYRDQIEQRLMEEAGIPEIRTLSPTSYLSRSKSPVQNRIKIALIFAEGPIVSSANEMEINPMAPGARVIHGPALAKWIEEATIDPGIRAILLRINSPGGAVVGSDLVYRAVRRARARGKKVVVSMSDVAGSGGYWIAMNADKIVCHPSTITGSIGVVFTKFDISGLYKLIGANISTVLVGKNADILSFAAELQGEKRDRIVSWMEQVYESFKKKVAEGRNLSLEEVEKVAQGRIWSGQDALELKLVDALGGLSKAVELVKEEAAIPKTQEVDLVLFPKQMSFFERLARGDLSLAHAAASLEGRRSLPDLRELHKAAQPRIEILSPTLELH